MIETHHFSGAFSLLTWLNVTPANARSVQVAVMLVAFVAGWAAACAGESARANATNPSRTKRYGIIDPGTMATISAPLERRLRRAQPGELVDIVVELQSDTTRPRAGASHAAHYAAIEQQFAAVGQQIEQFIRDSGGEVIASSWTASAIRARVPAESVARLQVLDRVQLIDLPHQLTRS